MTMQFQSADVADKFASYPEPLRERMLALRQLILDTAAKTNGVGRIAETLKWGQPSYLTPETGSGTTVRIDAHRSGGVAIFVHCQTSLIASFRAHYPELNYEGDRAIVLGDTALDAPAIAHCVAMALTYHARKTSPTTPSR